ncbi:MAG: hypothetical protein LUD68_08715 [Rikenellaceae bacterium]|nr:hypothetical protein [Rikenellaceae bacterium]
MKKIKKLSSLTFTELTPEEQQSIAGGMYIDCEYEFGPCPEGTIYIVHDGYCLCTPDDGTPWPPGDGGNDGGNPPSPCNNCNCLCMPGDNSSTAAWMGTKLANDWF